MNPLPIEYHLELYERSFINDPSMSVSTSNPTPTFAVGDLLDHRGFDRWSDPPGSGEASKVAEVRHILWEIKDSHIGHKLMIRLVVVRLPDEP